MHDGCVDAVVGGGSGRLVIFLYVRHMQEPFSRFAELCCSCFVAVLFSEVVASYPDKALN